MLLNASLVCPCDPELMAGSKAGQWPLMVNEQLTEWIAATFLIVLEMKLPFLCLSSGPQEAQAELWSPKAAKKIRGSTQSPEPVSEHRQVPAAAPGEAGMCNRVTAGWQQKALCKACHLMLYHLSPLDSVRRSQVLLLFQTSIWFSPLFHFLGKVCPHHSPADPSGSWLYWRVEKLWASFTAPKKALEVFTGEGRV